LKVKRFRLHGGLQELLISRSLGLEAGGAIGIPLFLSQALRVALYMIGFTEAWIRLFPGHNIQLVSSMVLLCLLVLSYTGANVAMKVQYVIMAVMVFPLVSFCIFGFSREGD
jgi:amino acid transporter